MGNRGPDSSGVASIVLSRPYARTVPWLIVLSDAVAATWVIENKTMAFRPTVPTHEIAVGDGFAIYISRSAHKDPKRDEAQIVATGTIASPVTDTKVQIARDTYSRTCGLRIEESLPLREGVSFRSLVGELSFIKQKEAWAAYVRRTIVRIPEEDLARITGAVRRKAKERA